VAGVVAALAVPVHELEVRLDGVAHGERPMLACGVVGAGNHALACLGEGLAIAQDHHAVRIAVVVGGGDGFQLVGLVADIMPPNPLAGAAERPGVAEMKSGLYRSIVGLAARPEATASRSGFQFAVVDDSGHGDKPPVSNIRPIYGGKTSVDKGGCRF